MTERPILFSGPMVRAILAGEKTQTRRVAHLADYEPVSWPCAPSPACPTCGATSGRVCQPPGPGETHMHATNGFNWSNEACPYGAPGDTLWVREAHAWADRMIGSEREDPCAVAYRADRTARLFEGDPGESEPLDVTGWPWDRFRWRPSIHMPRWASRLTLRVTDVRVERLQAITNADARAEGIRDTRGAREFAETGSATEREAFVALWDSINGKRPDCAWKDNPWAWVVSFVTEPAARKLRPPGSSSK